MKAFEEKILKEGTVLPGGVLKVGSFLNQQIDTVFMADMANEVKRLYDGEKITKVFTVEASGIAFAYAVAYALGVPMVYAKKHASANVSGELYTATVYSYTHGRNYEIVVSKDYISQSDRLLLVDDFLANGNAFRGLISIVEQAGASVAGLTAAIEKGCQGGGDALRKEGYKVESLAIIEKLEEGNITFRKCHSER